MAGCWSTTATSSVAGNGGIQQWDGERQLRGLAKGTGYYDAVNVTDGGKFAPGNSITDSGIGTLTLNSGSIYEFEINLANGLPGGGGTTPPQGWDRLSMSRLNVNSTPASPAIIQLVSRNAADTGPGTLPDFDPAQSYQWQAFQAEVSPMFSPGQVHLRHHPVRQPDQPVRGRVRLPWSGAGAVSLSPILRFPSRGSWSHSPRPRSPLADSPAGRPQSEVTVRVCERNRDGGYNGRFVGGFSDLSCVFSRIWHRLAPFQQKSGSFQGGKTIAIALFSWEFAFFDRRCQTPVFGKDHPRLEIPLFLHFRTTPHRP